MKKIIFFLTMFIQSAFLFAASVNWSVNSSEFEYSLTMTGVVEINGEFIGGQNDIVGAFVGDECRGVANASYVSTFDKHYFYLTVFSNQYEGEEIEFKFYKQAEDSIYTGFATATFSNSGNIGSASLPYVFSLGSSSFDMSISGDTIYENSTLNTKIGTLTGYNNQVVGDYSFALLSETELFHINGDSLYSSAVFDYETQSIYKVNIVGFNSDSTEVFEQEFNISVLDVDEAFTVTLSSNKIPENGSTPYNIGEFAIESKANYTFQLTENVLFDNGKFWLLGNRLYTDSVFNFEEKSIYNIELTISNAKSNVTQAFIIEVTDVEESGELNISNLVITEGNELNEFIAEISVSDEDLGENYTYSLMEHYGDNNNFLIKDDSLFAAIAFDYEAQTTHYISINANSDDGEKVTGNFEIEIANINDELIVLSDSTIEENNPTPQFIGEFSVNTKATYTFSLTDNASVDNDYFFLLGNRLYSDSVFNYEADSIFSIEVIATSNNLNSVTQLFTIKVDDKEEPGFMQLSCDSIAEGNFVSTFIGKLFVNDEDLNENYSFALTEQVVDNQSFKIVKDSLFADTSYNYEAQQLYTISVIATSADGNEVAEDFEIRILNVKEGELIISDSTLFENNQVPAFIGRLNVITDTPEETFEYSIDLNDELQNRWFYLHGDSIMTDSLLNYELITQLQFNAQAISSNNDTINNTFTIHILNIEERSIIISADSIMENNTPPTFIGKLQVIDNESELDYITKLDDYYVDTNFTIVNDSLFAISQLDYEAQSLHLVKIMAINSIKDTLRASMEIRVLNIPEQGEFSISNDSVVENGQSPEFVGFVTVESFIDTLNYTVEIDTSYADWIYFSFVNDSLFADSVFNYEIQNSFDLGFIQINSVGDTTYNEVEIFVIDEYEPTLLTLSNNKIKEGNNVSAFIGKLLVDSEYNTTYSFEIANAFDVNSFYIVADTLCANVVFDYNKQKEYEVEIKASSVVDTVYQTFTIRVTKDVIQGTVTISNNTINENMGVNHFIANIEVHGIDENINYDLWLHESAPFFIKGDSLMVSESLNFEDKSGHLVLFYFLNKATDDTTKTILTIDVLDSNEAPFNLTISNDTISENMPVWSFVATISVEDEDLGDSVIIFNNYPLGSDYPRFIIHGDSIFTNRVFDYEVMENLNLTLVARDKKGAEIEKTFIIRVIDEIETGIADNNIENDFNLYPNPAANYINIIANEGEFSKFQIYSTKGNLVMEQHYTSGVIDVSKLVKGIYHIRIISDNKVFSSQFIKQ